MKLRQLIVASVISMVAFSANAAFAPGMTSAQIRAEIATQRLAGATLDAIARSALRARLSLTDLVAVLVTVQGVNPAAAVTAVVKVAPLDVVAIAAAAADAAPASAAASIAAAAAKEVPSAAVDIAKAVAAEVPAEATAITQQVSAEVPSAATEIAIAVASVTSTSLVSLNSSQTCTGGVSGC